MGPTINIPATRGQMGNSPYYVGIFPLGMVSKLFKYEPNKQNVSPEMRAQRKLVNKRIPEIASYMLDHENWLFSSLTVSFDNSEMEFKQVDDQHPDIGVLVIPLEAEFIVNDGQHRAAAIEQALDVDPLLAKQSISVVLFPHLDTERAQQMFSDLNRTVRKTSKSLDILYDHRDPLNRITLSVIDEVPLFKDSVDKDAVSLSANSRRFATLSAVYAANEQLVGKLDEGIDPAEFDALESFAIEYWRALTDFIPEWNAIAAKRLKAHDARAEYISSHALALHALGALGHEVREQHGASWEPALAKIVGVDWRKTNDDWQGICMINAEVVTRGPTRRATAQYLKWKLGLGEKPNTVL